VKKAKSEKEKKIKKQQENKELSKR